MPLCGHPQTNNAPLWVLLSGKQVGATTQGQPRRVAPTVFATASETPPQLLPE